MYINDVIRLVKSFYPSEYDEWEMYVWCNEVSALLLVEDRNIFSEAYLNCDKKGRALLPEYVRIENIERVTLNGLEVEKQDLRTAGRRINCGGCGIAHIVYLEPYRAIRLVRYRGNAEINGDSIRIDKCEFLKGDIIDIAFVGGSEKNGVSVLDIRYDNGYVIKIGKGTLNEIDGENSECIITRVVTEKTVCPAPYDSMYVDYIIAKINLYQHDIEQYNIHMSSFNKRLGDYKKQLIGKMPKGEGRFKNWWV